MVVNDIYTDIGIIIIVATFVGYLAKFFRQPLIPAYILAGVIFGPSGIGLVTDTEVIKLLAELGIALLLFVVGLELDLSRLKIIGLIASIGGTLQTFLLFLIGFIMSLVLGFVYIEAIYLALILAFSSTLVVVKMLSDRKELDTLHARIAIGILLVQDIIAILAMAVLTTINDFSPAILIVALLRGVSLLLIAALLGHAIFPPLFKIAARSKEILFLVSVSVCFLFSLISLYLDFSVAIGAFIAGITLGNLPYNLEIISLVKPIRDFFATLFFASLGMALAYSDIESLLLPFMVFIGFIMIVKPFITLMLTLIFGYAKRTSFLTAIGLAQISEFSLIIVTQGVLLGHIGQDIFTLTVLIAIVTIALSSYLVHFDNFFYNLFIGPLKFLEKISNKSRELQFKPDNDEYQMILVGADRTGSSIVPTFRNLKKSFLVIDFNPNVIKRLMRKKVPCIYGDIGDFEIIERINFKAAKIVISTVPNLSANLFLVKKVKERNKKTLLLVTANKVEEALQLYNRGADYVVLPHYLGGEHVSFLLQELDKDINHILKTKLRHLKKLNRHKATL